MSQRSPQDHEREPTDSPEPVATPRRPRRRVDPAGDTLHTGSTLKRPLTDKDAPPSPPQTSEPPASKPPASEPTAPEPLPTQVFPSSGAHAATPQPTRPPAVLTEPLEDSFEDEASARAKARDRAVVGSPAVAVVMQVALAILAPITILIFILRVVASPLLLWFEYNRPGFPADQYGMDTEQRRSYGSYGLDYLFNLAPPSYLGDLTFANGNPLFTQEEVAHMADVKQVITVTMIAGIVMAVICIVLMILLSRMRKGAIARSLFAGAIWFTAALIILAVVALLGWEAFFAGFHQIFFADGTWTFYTTDTLIRLYPGQFWIDAAIWIAALTLVTMATIIICTAPTGRRRFRNEQAQRFMESQVVSEPKAHQP
ncbi:MAG: TIGR01906 family membrane protein [Micrococcaceae bacterium]|nr:TIGR01906 family membrane protein [Micrococcaceae bacterium]